MSGKGDADTRSPDINARSRTWDRVFRNRWTLEDALEAMDQDPGRYFECRDLDQVHMLEAIPEQGIRGQRLFVYRGAGYKGVCPREAMISFLNGQLGPDRVWHRV